MVVSAKRRELHRRARRAVTEPLPDLYAQLTPRKERLRPTSSRYWLSGYPKLVVEWHPTLNGELFPDVLRYGSERSVWWKCARGPDHEWKAHVANRVRGAGCPFCANRRASVTNSLATLHPDIAAEWHPSRNKKLRPTDVVAGTTRAVWWKCEKGPDHVWKLAVVRRTNEHAKRCPICSGHRVAPSTCLARVSPTIAREWHPTKNGELSPRDVTRGSGKRVWWRCKKGHEWRTPVSGRVLAGRGCPCCAGQRVTSSTSLAAVHPDAARLWHPTRNGDTTARDVLPDESPRVVAVSCRPRMGALAGDAGAISHVSVLLGVPPDGFEHASHAVSFRGRRMASNKKRIADAGYREVWLARCRLVALRDESTPRLAGAGEVTLAVPPPRGMPTLLGRASGSGYGRWLGEATASCWLMEGWHASLSESQVGCLLQRVRTVLQASALRENESR